MSYLAIDFGTKRVGVAVSRGTLAVPLVVLANEDNLFEELLKIIEQEETQKIIVGLSENEMALKTEEFVRELKAKTEIPVEFADETLSSREVEQRLQNQGIKHKVRSGPIDHFAAAIILENWLEQQQF
ncbi:MAG: Holliday junction resolvase RuvX [Patescibacteria group bacterium]